MIVVIDYGAGNLRSVTNLLDEIEAKYSVVDNPDGFAKASHVILPGVGHFGQICDAFDKLDLRDALIDSIQNGVPYLGICLGMQILFESSEESSSHRGLAILSGAVRKFDVGERVPHMGWNSLEGEGYSRLLGASVGDCAYFAHSYFCPINSGTVRFTTHGLSFSSMIEQQNIFGVQFHPEKSGALGAALMRRFVGL